MHRCTIVFDYRLPETVLSLHLYVALLETSKGRLSHSFYVVGHMQPTLVFTGLLEDLIQTFNYFQDPDCASLEADDVWACRILIGWQVSRNRARSDSRAQSTNHEKTQSAKYKAGKAQTAAAATLFIILTLCFTSAFLLQLRSVAAGSQTRCNTSGTLPPSDNSAHCRLTDRPRSGAGSRSALSARPDIPRAPHTNIHAGHGAFHVRRSGRTPRRKLTRPSGSPEVNTLC